MAEATELALRRMRCANALLALVAVSNAAATLLRLYLVGDTNAAVCYMHSQRNTSSWHSTAQCNTYAARASSPGEAVACIHTAMSAMVASPALQFHDRSRYVRVGCPVRASASAMAPDEAVIKRCEARVTRGRQTAHTAPDSSAPTRMSSSLCSDLLLTSPVARAVHPRGPK